MEMTGVQEYEFASKALVFGGVAIAVNILPFVFMLLKEIKKSKESNNDNFNLLASLAWIYGTQLLAVMIWFFSVKTINAMDESENFLPLLGNNGLFHYFWYENLSGIIQKAQDKSNDVMVFYAIQWTRMWFDVIVTGATFLVLIWGISIGYSQGKKNVTDDGVKLGGYAFFGFLLSLILLGAYDVITQDSFFNEKSISEVASGTWYKLIIEMK